MEAFKLMAGGAIFGVVASFWASIKGFIWRFFNLFLQDVEVQDPVTVYAVVGYLISTYQKVGLYDKIYSSNSDYIRSEKRNGRIPFEFFGGKSLIFRHGWRFLYFCTAPIQQADNTQNTSSGSNQPKQVCYFIYLRGTFDIDKIISEAIQQYNQVTWATEVVINSLRKRFFVKYLPDISKDEAQKGSTYVTNWQYQKYYRLLDRRPEDIGIGTGEEVRMLDRLFFPDEILELIEEIKLWRKSRDVYQEMGIPWKRGWMFHGPGGTGKTALASAFAHDLDMPIFVFNLSELHNLEFMREWKKMLAHVPCIALIEDIDNVFHGRQNISRGDEFSFGHMFSRIDKGPIAANTNANGSQQQGPEDEVSRRFGTSLSFDVLLNCLDGVDRCEGLFTIITTNHIEHIDPALGQPVDRGDGTRDFISSRPGRIDKAIELGHMLPYVKEKMALHILGRFPDHYHSFIDEVRNNPRTETPAQFQERCSQIALKAFWKQEDAKKKAEDDRKLAESQKNVTIPFVLRDGVEAVNKQLADRSKQATTNGQAAEVLQEA